LYVPVADDQGRQLVDGGLVAVIPATVARSLGADIVIAVDVNSAGATFFGSSLRSVFGVLLQSMILIQKSVSHHQLASADFVISPRVGHIRWDQLRRSEQLIAAGYEAGAECATAIQALIEKKSLELHPSPLGVAKIS
jgi:NTE family protein